MYNKPPIQQPLYPINPQNNDYPSPLMPNQPQIYPNNSPYIPPQNPVPPQNYIPIPTQPPVINQPMPKYNYMQNQMDQTNNSPSFSELFDDLSEVRAALIAKYFQGGFIGIGEKQKYKVSIVFKDGNLRNIFICQRNSSFFNNDTYNFEIRMKYIPRDSTDAILETKDFDQRLIDIVSKNEYGYIPKINAINKENNINMGTIQQPGVCPCCCKDPNYEIYPRYGQKTIPKYSITTRGTQCSYCCCPDCCCAQGETSFQIFSNAARLYSGNILKRSFNRDRKDYLFYDIDFPDVASPEEKLLVICAAIGIDNVVYKELGSNI